MIHSSKYQLKTCTASGAVIAISKVLKCGIVYLQCYEDIFVTMEYCTFYSRKSTPKYSGQNQALSVRIKRSINCTSHKLLAK